MTDGRPTSDLQPHPQAARVPAMVADEYQAFLLDIAVRGLQAPLEITPAGIVLDGHQRLRAAIELGLETVPVVVVPHTVDEVEYMLLAALRRRQLSDSQRAALAVELEQVRHAREQARSRSNANLKQGTIGPEVATLPPRQGKTRDHAAQLAGVSARLIQDALTVQQADPDLFEQVKAGRIPASVASRRIRRQHRDLHLPEALPLPNGPFQVVYADPPWQLGNPDGPYAPENHYPTLTLDQLKALQPPATEDALLYLWAVNCLLPEALKLMEAWGFVYKTNLVWVKPSIGLGKWTRNRHELLLLGRKGSHPPPDPEDLPDSVIEADRRRHSQKPDQVYELIERAHPTASKLELFARGTTPPGWTTWGNQLDTADNTDTP